MLSEKFPNRGKSISPQIKLPLNRWNWKTGCAAFGAAVGVAITIGTVVGIIQEFKLELLLMGAHLP
jgi:hypothetical protein